MDVPDAWAGKIVRLRCRGIDDDADVYINGELLLSNVGYSTPINAEVSGVIKPGQTNTIAIRVHDPYIDGGIYRSIYLTAETPELPPPIFTQPQRQLDREMFAQHRTAQVSTYDSKAVRAVSPNKPVFMKEFNLKTPAENPRHQLDSFIVADAHFDVTGCDMYKPAVWYPMAIDMLRSTGRGKPVWLMETHYFDPVRDVPESLDQWTWSMAVRGLRGVYFWGLDVGYEGDGRVNDFAVELARMQRRFDALRPVLAALRNVQVVMYLPRDSQFLCDRLEIDQGWQQIWHMLSGVNGINVPVDFIDDQRIAAGDLDKYKCLIAPPSPYLPRQTADRMMKWAGRGGSMIMWSGTAVYDYAGQPLSHTPGWGLSVMASGEAYPKMPASAQLELTGPITDEPITCDAGMLRHTLVLIGGQPLLSDQEGMPVACRMQTGQGGSAVLTALDLGPLFAQPKSERRDALAAMMYTLLEQCGVELRVEARHDGVETHLLEDGPHAWLVLINHNNKPQTVNVTTRPKSGQPFATVYDALTMELFTLQIDDGGQRGEYEVPAEAVRVIKVAGSPAPSD